MTIVWLAPQLASLISVEWGEVLAAWIVWRLVWWLTDPRRKDRT